MLETCTTSQERWGGVHQLIDRWLAERNQLIMDYTRLRQRVHTPDSADTALSAFCDVLVDYVSAGHFEIYEQLLREAQDFDDQRGIELAHQVYPRIEAITREAVTFNDSYGQLASIVDEEQMQQRLQQLGALLHERFELEDCLIEVLHNAHKDLLSTV
ncbi:sigma D regulator [Halopseudomonas oceani]|jgi:regulator of sigma D|uniref:Sigma D regulator n=1 Tax=Halopseudomonas oceani TaxID=1708783 RepID=A0A2P4EVT9_9GAMM|nr:sigma D regulator [Halopseudomonas oceani]POB03735.1 sigma D regulator [Halopseudomonas oceani]GGE47017.1 sigma D regulator [Halopseudomonas oceani]